MAEDGITDYGVAKRKAAKQLGVSAAAGLPTNDEIEQALREHQALFQDEDQPQWLHELRLAALQVMERLAMFRPCLTGAVQDGTAGNHSVVELDVFAESSKDLEIFLLSEGISYQSDDNQRRNRDGRETRLGFDWEGYPVQLNVYPAIAERSQPRNPHSGHRRSRLTARELSDLIVAQEGVCK
jgi:hypothetical protein